MALPQVKRQVKHLAALDWREVPNLMEELTHRESVSARTLEFIILTAARSGEARGACWSEINDGVWTVPASRMKRGIEHRVPQQAPRALGPVSVIGPAKAQGLTARLQRPRYLMPRAMKLNAPMHGLTYLSGVSH